MDHNEYGCATVCDGDICLLDDDILFDEGVCSHEFSEGCKLPAIEQCEEL